MYKLFKFFKTEGFKKYFANTSWLLGDKVFKALIGVVAVLYLANYLGPEEYGVLIYSQSIIGLISTISGLGLSSILVRELVKYKEKDKIILGTGLILRFIGASFSILIVIVTVLSITEDARIQTVAIILSFSSLFNSFKVIERYFESRVQGKYVAIVTSGSYFISNILIITLVFFQFDLVYFAVAYLLQYIFTSVGFVLFYYQKVGSLFNWRFEYKTAKSLLVDSWPLIPHSLSFSVISNIDQFMIGLMLGNQAVGIYGLAYKLIMKLYTGMAIFTKSLFPALVKEGDIQEGRFIMFYRFMIGMSLLIIFSYYLFGSVLLELVIDIEYEKTFEIINILIIASLPMSMMAATGKWYIVHNHTKLLLFRTMTGAICNILLNFILINYLGLLGAVFATLTTVLYITYLSAFLHFETRNNITLIHKAIFLGDISFTK
ncbi:MAG: flippase [Bacteroidota bacterium]